MSPCTTGEFILAKGPKWNYSRPVGGSAGKGGGGEEAQDRTQAAVGLVIVMTLWPCMLHVTVHKPSVV